MPTITIDGENGLIWQDSGYVDDTHCLVSPSQEDLKAAEHALTQSLKKVRHYRALIKSDKDMRSVIIADL